MRVKSLDISGFRAFSGNERFDLDADIVFVVGANGQGKTSFFDAIHWAMTGRLSRLETPQNVVSLFSHSGEARVELTLVSEQGRIIVLTRQYDGSTGGLLLQEGDEVFRGEDAEHQLISRLWPEGLAANEPQAALRAALERGVYLQQDTLTGFLIADNDQERFKAITELIGAGRATELQVALENSRRAWTRATTRSNTEMVELEERLSRLESQLQELKDVGPSSVLSSAEWTNWWTEARRLGVSETRIPSIETLDAHSAIDGAMVELRTIRLSLERRADRLRQLATALQELPSTPSDLATLQQTTDDSVLALENAKRALSEAEERATEIRRRQTQAREQQQELRVLAEIALRHLGEHCPVCQQQYDIEATRDRLNSLLRGINNTEAPLDPVPDLTQFVERVQVLEGEAAGAAAELRNAQRQEQVRVEGEERIRFGLAELALGTPHDGSTFGAIDSALQENKRDQETLATLQNRGEALALSLARAGQLARQSELVQEVLSCSHDLATARREVAARQYTGDLVSRMIEGLRDASSDLVEEELKRLEPLLQRIYATADPHPEFRVVRLLSRMRQGHGRVVAEVEDPVHDHKRDTPGTFLSSSQMNVLAVSVFLALNLGIPTLPLRMAVLDDPLQSLDDLNLLGLIDLLRRMRERRQLMISTHDTRLASLLERKLRPVSDTQRTICVELNGWSSGGPVVSQRDIVGDPVPIRIAAA